MSPATRRLAAIMFTDMVGYTALMQSDESAARTKQQRQKTVLEKLLDEYGGRLLQNYGDGSMSLFTSAIDCVNCAIAIQRELRKEPVVDLRIGIHSGDVLLDENGIYGDGVNIASRIETLAVPGGVFISERVYDDLRNQKNISVADIGYFDLKNVEQPVHILAISNEGLVVPSRDELRGKTRQPVNSLAVLPFINLSGNPDKEYLSDGFTEELLNALTAVDGLRVTSRTSSFALKGKNDDIRQIGARLNVDKIVEGSVRMAGNRIRVTAQLINTADGFHLWSETFDRNLDDIFEVQDEISRIIANKLRTRLNRVHKDESLIRIPTRNLEAYALFLKGKFHHNKETPAEMLQAIEYYRQAITLDPNFVLPYVFLAGAHALLSSVGVIPTQQAYTIIVDSSNKALQLDDSLAECYVARAVACLFYEWKWDEAYRALQKAIELNPGSPTSYWVLGYYYLIMDKPHQAVETLEISYRQDPLSISLARSLSFAYFFANRYDEVIRFSSLQLKEMPMNWFASSMKAFATGMKGDWESAWQQFQESNRNSGGAPITCSLLALCAARLGKKEESLSYIRQLEAFKQQKPLLSKYTDLLLAWWGYGDLEKSFDCLFKAIANKEEMIPYLINSPVYDKLREDPRFNEARKRMNL